ncbi:MAG: response regulator [Deltaproteobacteria bacterium]|nr:response regulator [Deltaproteobacteria bacterium]MBN2688719.1 response regulator [Deltaproteobacteria bacterium]
MSKLFFSTSEVARLFKVNRVTIYRWAKDGKLKAYEIGKNMKIPISEVRRLLNEFGLSLTEIQDMCDSTEDAELIESARYLSENWNGKKLVVAIDDNADLLTLIENLFEQTDLKDFCRLLTFSDSLEAALQIGGGGKPDVLLADVRMSGLDGVELAKKVRSMHQDVKIIFMSGYPREEIEERITDMEVVDYLMKPFDFKTLHSLIHKTLH